MVEETICVFVSTNIGTCLGLLIHENESVFVFKNKICMEHEHHFPTFGKITISAAKVKCRSKYYHVPDFMILRNLFQEINTNKNLFLFVDVICVKDKAAELLTNSKPDSILKTNVSEKKSKKRKHKTSKSKNVSLEDKSSGKREAKTFEVRHTTIWKVKLLTGEMYQTTDVPENKTDSKVTSGAMKNETESDTKKKAAEGVKFVVKPKKKKIMKKKGKPPSNEEDIQVASTPENV